MKCAQKKKDEKENKMKEVLEKVVCREIYSAVIMDGTWISR